MENIVNLEQADAIKAPDIELMARVAELEAANHDLESFNYSVAHGLQNSLVWIGGYSRLILKNNLDKLDSQYKGYLQEVIQGVEQLEQYIDALLNFFRLTHLPMNTEPVDLTELVQSVVGELKRIDPVRKVTLRIAEDATAEGDRQLLRVVLQNLLENAWKYTGMQKDATIEFGVMNNVGIPIYFVRDNGTGFDQKSATLIFNPFQRLSETHEFKGFGIGLSLVNRIIQRHGGKVWTEAEQGTGATFYFTLKTTGHIDSLKTF